MEKLSGIFPALVTPMQENGDLNLAALPPLVGHLLGQGVDGFYVAGSTGECFLLSAQERRQVLEAVVAAVHGRGKVIAHIGALSTRESMALAKHAACCGADAVSAVAPFYYKYSKAEILSHYEALLDSTPLPLLVYNFPAQSGVTFTMEDFSLLARHENFAGLKHTSSDFYQLERFIHAYPQLSALNGYDEMFLAGLATGADGGIGSTYNILATRFLALRRLVQAGQLAQARLLQAEINAFIAELTQVGVAQGVKYILTQQGFAAGPCRLPLHSLTAAQREQMDRLAQRL